MEKKQMWFLSSKKLVNYSETTISVFFFLNKLPVRSKIFEEQLYGSIVEVYRREQFEYFKSGFISDDLCTQYYQLLSITNETQRSFYDSQEMRYLFLDIFKPLVKVLHVGLILKLTQNRKQRMALNDLQSNTVVRVPKR